MTANSFITKFLKHEASGGILLVGSSVIAMIIANSSLDHIYDSLINLPMAVKIGSFSIDKPLLLWVNDGLMAVFFLLVGLELKREFLEGELSERKKIILPGLGAIGGMVVPATIYVIFNANNGAALNGWAIPAATDIAFALGVLSLLGSRVPVSLKIFLTSLAIFDDVGAILIIAFFYTSNLSITALTVALISAAVLFIMNKKGVAEKSPYIIIGIVLWTALLKSGVHATLAGVLLAMFIPMTGNGQEGESPLKSLEHDLHSAIAYLILPVFAFFNSGISFSGFGIEQITHSVPAGIAAGLFFGKQLGVFLFSWAGIKLGLAAMPAGMNWTALYGTAVLCGIGFTMSLFIGSLAFEETGVDMIIDERVGIILGSLASGITGYVVLRKSLR